MFSGTVRATMASHELARIDANAGGPLATSWRYNIGGFYRRDKGIRTPGWTADKGGQIKANLTGLLKNGFLRLYAKYLHDNVLWLQPELFMESEFPAFNDWIMSSMASIALGEALYRFSSQTLDNTWTG